MNLTHLCAMLATLDDQADRLDQPDTLDPDPAAEHLREAAHLIRHLPLLTLAKLPAYPAPPPAHA